VTLFCYLVLFLDQRDHWRTESNLVNIFWNCSCWRVDW